MIYLPNTFKYILFSGVLLSMLSAFSQEKSTSLQTSLTDTDQEEISILQKKLTTAITSLDSAKIYNQMALLNLKSEYYINVPQYDSIIYYAGMSKKLTYNKKSKESIYHYLYSLRIAGSTYKSLGNTSIALEYFNKILSTTDTIREPQYYYRLRQAATTFIASFYASQKNYQLAINQYNSLFDYVQNKKIDTTNISSIVYLRYARFHRKLDKLDIALVYTNKAMKVAKRNNLFYRVAMSYLELANIKLTSNDIEKAEYFIEKAHLLLIKNPKYKTLLSEYYRIKSVIAQKNSNLIEHVLNAKKAFNLRNEKAISKSHIELGDLLYEAYKANGDFEKAIEVNEEMNAIERKLFNDDELKKSTLLEIQKRDRNIASQKAKGETKNKIIFWIIILLILGVFGIIYLCKDWKRKNKFAEKITKKNEQLKELDKVKSNFFSNITHELQTPLTLIKGPLELELKENSKVLYASTKSRIQMAVDSAESLKTMVNDILDLTKLEAKKLVLERKRTDLDTFLNTVMRKFTSVMKQKKFHFQYCFKDIEGYKATLDTQKLEKIINNLLSNAIKYTPLNGTIKVCGNLKDKNLILSVNDTGAGIPKGDIPHVFERYFQSKDVTKPLEGGYGIGLSLVKELVELMNGTIKIESEIKKGTQFEVILPLENLNKKKFHNTQVTAIPYTDDAFALTLKNIEDTMQQHNVLIVEDHEEMQQFIGSILQKRYRLTFATNGKEALEKLKHISVDLIISDVMMPAMDGFTLLEKLKKSKEYQSIPIILLTALADIQYKLKALTIGADDYLKKPFSASELSARAYNLLKRYQNRKVYKSKEEMLAKITKKEVDNTNALHIQDSTNFKKSDSILIAKVAEIIEENIENPNFKLNNLPEKVYLSERQLRRKIKLITGLKPKKFQQEIQLLKAQKLLEEDTYSSVTAVAISVGMQHVTRFNKMYVERFGKHPSDYFTL